MQKLWISNKKDFWYLIFSLLGKKWKNKKYIDDVEDLKSFSVHEYAFSFNICSPRNILKDIETIKLQWQNLYLPQHIIA